MGYVFRYAPFYKEIYKLVNIEKAIGKIISLEFNECISYNHGSFILGNWRKSTEDSGG